MLPGVPWTTPRPMTPPTIPDIVAHRGYALHYPENTLSAVHAAIDSGARHVEVDVQITTDGVPVLFHDEDLARLCDTAGLLQDLSMTAVQGLRAAYRTRFGDRFADEPVPSLAGFAALIAAHPTVTAFVEIKPEAVARHGAKDTLAAVESALGDTARQCVLISFDVAFLGYVRERNPGWPIAVVVEQWTSLQAADVLALAAEYAFCDLEGLPADGLLKAPGNSRVVVYEVGTAALARGLAERGIDLVETFACGELLRELAAAREVHRAIDPAIGSSNRE
jgi:glycerophosphoryl diester phosphodiesterase